MAACYCTFCGSYGHKPTTCDRRPTDACRPSRPAQAAQAGSKAAGPTLEIDTDDRAMRAFLYSKGESIAGKTEALQDRIVAWAGKNSYISVEFK
jgi:hypothetical protein